MGQPGGREPSNADDRIYMRIQALHEMRKQMTKLCTARVCMGGNIEEFSGRFPGIMEEALLALEAKQPIYLSGLVGGATRQIIDAIRYTKKKMPDDFAIAEKAIQKATKKHEPSPMTPAALWQKFSSYNLSRLSRLNRLTTIENKRLFDAVTPHEVFSLVTLGLSRI